MAFNLTAQLNLVGPTNIKQIASQIKKDLGNINATVQFKLDPNVAKNVAGLSSSLKALNSTFANTVTSATAASSAIKSFGNSINSIKINNIPQKINATANSITSLNKESTESVKALAGASGELVEFGKQAGLAVRRFVAFSAVTSIIYGVTNSINNGVQAFIDYDKELVKLQQVTGESASGLAKLQSQITNLSVAYGVSSKELTTVASTLAQAGLSARETEKALKALALSSLAPSFDDMNETVEGSIALMRQFGISAEDLEASLGSVNTVAARFAVESKDIITAIQRTGSVFATASKGVSEGKDALNEFIAVFTSVRATTRESAETIATGLRTIFTRVQRGQTIDALKEFGVNLTDAEGKFVGAYKAVELLSSGLNKLDPRSLDFSRIVEELGGFRQIGKVIPLIQQFAVTQEALKVAQRGQGSLARDAATAQLSLANQISKVREEFFALFREIGQSKGFQTLIRGALSLVSGLIKVTDAVKGILPALAVITAFKGAKGLTQFIGGFNTGVKRGPDGKANGGIIRKFARGGVVPGTGSGDTVPAMLEPGEFVIRKKAVETIGSDNLHNMNKYGSGGSIRGGRAGKRKKFAKGGAAEIASIDGNQEATDGDTFTATVTPTGKPFTASFRVADFDTYEIGNKKSRVSEAKAVDLWDIPKNKNKKQPEQGRSGFVIPSDYYVSSDRTASKAAEDGRKALQTQIADFKDTSKIKIGGGFGRYLASGFTMDSSLTTGRKWDESGKLEFARGGKIQKFMAGGKTESAPFGTGETKFPKRITNAYAKELQKKLDKEKVDNAWYPYPSNERITIDPEEVSQKFQNEPFDRKRFLGLFNTKISRNELVGNLSDFAKFIGLPGEDLAKVLPQTIDFGGELQRSGNRGTFSRDPFGTQGYDNKGLEAFGFTQVDEQDLFGYQKLMDEKTKEIQKIMKTPTRTFDDGSFSYDSDAFTKAMDEKSSLGKKISDIMGKRAVARKGLMEQKKGVLASTGRGFVSMASNSFERNQPKNVLYHELTHQLLNSLRTQSEDSFTKYKERVSQLFNGDNDDLADAFDALGGSYNSADVVYGRSYKNGLLNNVLQDLRRKTMDAGGRSADPDLSKEAYSMWVESGQQKNAREYRPINPKINDILLKGGQKQETLEKVEDYGKEEFLTTLIQNAPKLDSNMTGILDSTLSELLSNAGIQRQQYAEGGKVTRNLGYIDFDVINDPANAQVVENSMKEAGVDGPRNYTEYLTNLAIKARKEKSLKSLKALYGVAGAGKSSIVTGRGSNDTGTLRQTNRFPILTPEDIIKASEVMLLTSTVSQDKLEGMLQEVDRAYTLSSTTKEEKDRILKQRTMRDVSGVGLFGRAAGSTAGAALDTVKEEALLEDRLGSKSVVLGRKEDGGLRRKTGDELVQATKKKIGLTWGGFAPTTVGHESMMEAAKAAGIPYEDFIALVGSDEAVDAENYRTAVFDKDFRLALAKAGFGSKGASVLPKTFGDMSVPLAFDMGEKDGRRQVTLAGEGSMAFVADKTEKQMEKYKKAGYGVSNLERTGGISGTQVRDLVLNGNLEGLQQVVSPSVFSLLKGNMTQLQNRSNVLPTLIEQAEAAYKEEVASIDQQLLATGITRADNKKAETDPEYAAQLELYQSLKDKKKKLQTKKSFEPYRLLKQLAVSDPAKYGLRFDTDPSVSGSPSVPSSAIQQAILAKVTKETSVKKSSGILPAQGTEILKRFGAERLPNDPSFGPFSGKTVRDTADGGKLKYWNSAFRPETKADKLAYYTATRDYLIDKFKQSQGTKSAQALSDTTSAVLSSQQLGLVGLNPLGYTGLLGPETWNLGTDPSGQERSIDASIVQRGLPNQYQNVIDYLSGQTEEIVGGASKLLGIVPNKLSKKQRETLGQGNIEGALLEQIFGSAGAGILDDALRTRPIDFPMGIGPKAASIFGIDPDIPTEVKRTIDSGSRGKAVEEFQRYFRQQYGIPDPEKEVVKLAGGGLLQKYGEIFPDKNSTGPFKEMVFDFDDTLVSGGEIRKQDGSLDLSQKDNIPLVEQMLKKGKLTPLGQHLSEAMKQEPSLVDNLSILSARNQNQAGILADTLSRLGLPIPVSKIRGSDGPQNKKISGYQKMIDDNMETISRLKSEGKEAIHYKFAKGGKVEEEYKQILASILPKEMLTSDGYLKMKSGQAEPIEFMAPDPIKRSKDEMLGVLLGKEQPTEQSGSAFFKGGVSYKTIRHRLEQNKNKIPTEEYDALKSYVNENLLFEGNDDIISTMNARHKGVLPHETFHDVQGYLYDNHPEIMDKLFASVERNKDGISKWYNDPKNSQWTGSKDYKLEHFFPGQTTRSPYPTDVIEDAANRISKKTKQPTSIDSWKILGMSQQDMGRNEAIPVLLSAAAENNTGAAEILSKIFTESGLNPDFYKTLPKYADGGMALGLEDTDMSSLVSSMYGSAGSMARSWQGAGLTEGIPERYIGAAGVAGLQKSQEKKPKNYSKIGLRSDGSEITATYFKNNDRQGFVSAKKATGNLFTVGLSKATQGYGPRLYDIVMEAATAAGGMLTSDRNQVSESAKSVWSYYFNNRSDVKKTPLDPSQWTKNHSYLDPKLYGRKETWPPPSDPAWILQSGYNKSADLINSPDVINMNDPKYAEHIRAQQLSFLSRNGGGSIRKFASGGNTGLSSEDTVPALLTPGEFVINKKAAQNIGYSKLEKLNKADKIQGFNKGGAVGGVIQKFATGGPAVQKLQSRPSETSSSTIEVSSEISSFSKNLVDELDKAGYSMKSLKNIIEQMGKGADISYKQMENALEKDLQRLKISGASIEATVQAEKALSDVRNQSKANIVKRQFLEAGFKESKVGKTLGSGASQQKILSLSEKYEKFLTKNKSNQIRQEILSDPSPKNRLTGEALEKAIKDKLQEAAQEIKSLSITRATEVTTGIKSSELSSMDISGSDIKNYITQSTTDRKTLAQMDKQLIAMRLEEYKNAGTVRGIAAQSASEALALAKEEVSKRRQIINEMAKEDGSKGVGAAGLTDFSNSPVLNTLKDRYFDGDSGKFKGSTALGDIGMVAGLVGGQGENIANQMYDTRTDSGKVQAAKTSVAIQNAGSTLATGLTTAAQLAPINPLVAALVAIGTAAYAGVDAFYDFSGAQADAAAAMEKSIRADKIAYATDVLNKSFETLMKSTTDLALKMDYVSKARTLIDLTKEDSNIEAATNKGDQERRTWSQYYFGGGPLADIGQAMGISSGNAYAKEGVNGLELKDYQRLGAKQSEAFASLGNQGYRLLPEAYKQGFSREDLIKNMDLSGEDNKTGITRAQVEAMVLSDPNKATEYQIRMAKGQDSGDRYLKEQTDNFFNTNAQALAAEKADKMARALEAANNAGRRLADSFELLSKNINESIGRTNFESDARTEAMKQNSDALRGKSESSGPKLRELNVLNSPSAYTDKEYDSALSSATSGIKNDRVKQQIVGGSQLEQRLPKAIKEAISTEVKGNANLDIDKASRLAITAANAEIDKLNLQSEQKDDLKTIARTKIEEQAEKTRKTLAGKGDKAMVDDFLKSLDSAKDITGDFSSKMSEVAKELLSFRQGALKQFAEGLNASSKALKDSRNYEKKARDIRNSGNMNFREVTTGVGETFEERQARMNGDVASLTGGITGVAGIKNRMLSLQASRQNIVTAQGATGGDPAAAAKLEENLRAVDDKLRDTAEALEILATSTELVEKAFNDLKNVRELQKNRESFINTLLTNTPEEADKLNQTFIRLQRNLSGGLNDASNQRDARKAFNQTLRETGSVREATRAGNTVLANQRKETLAASQDPGFRAAQELNIRNQYAQNKGQPGVSADQAVADYFKQQDLQLTKSLAIESGMINNPLVRQSIAAKEDPTTEPAMAQAADRYLKAVGLQSDATKAQGELAKAQGELLLLESQQILAASNNNLKTSIDELNARIDTLILGDAGGGAKGIVGTNSIGESVVQLASRGGLMYAQEGQYVNFQPKGTDTVPAMLTPGEFVINAKSTSEHLPLLKSINSGYFDQGGLVSNFTKFDKNKNRLLDRKEFTEYFSDFDLNKDDAIDMKEFRSGINKQDLRRKALFLKGSKSRTEEEETEYQNLRSSYDGRKSNSVNARKEAIDRAKGQIRYERQQAYLSRFRPEIRERKEERLLRSGMLYYPDGTSPRGKMFKMDTVPSGRGVGLKVRPDEQMVEERRNKITDRNRRMALNAIHPDKRTPDQQSRLDALMETQPNREEGRLRAIGRDKRTQEENDTYETLREERLALTSSVSPSARKGYAKVEERSMERARREAGLPRPGLYTQQSRVPRSKKDIDPNNRLHVLWGKGEANRSSSEKDEYNRLLKGDTSGSIASNPTPTERVRAGLSPITSNGGKPDPIDPATAARINASYTSNQPLQNSAISTTRGTYPKTDGTRADNIGDADFSKFATKDWVTLANDPANTAAMARQIAQHKLFTMGLDKDGKLLAISSGTSSASKTTGANTANNPQTGSSSRDVLDKKPNELTDDDLKILDQRLADPADRGRLKAGMLAWAGRNFRATQAQPSGEGVSDTSIQNPTTQERLRAETEAEERRAALTTNIINQALNKKTPNYSIATPTSGSQITKTERPTREFMGSSESRRALSAVANSGGTLAEADAAAKNAIKSQAERSKSIVEKRKAEGRKVIDYYEQRLNEARADNDGDGQPDFSKTEIDKRKKEWESSVVNFGTSGSSRGRNPILRKPLEYYGDSAPPKPGQKGHRWNMGEYSSAEDYLAAQGLAQSFKESQRKTTIANESKKEQFLAGLTGAFFGADRVNTDSGVRTRQGARDYDMKLFVADGRRSLQQDKDRLRTLQSKKESELSKPEKEELNRLTQTSPVDTSLSDALIQQSQQQMTLTNEDLSEYYSRQQNPITKTADEHGGIYRITDRNKIIFNDGSSMLLPVEPESVTAVGVSAASMLTPIGLITAAAATTRVPDIISRINKGEATTEDILDLVNIGSGLALSLNNARTSEQLSGEGRGLLGGTQTKRQARIAEARANAALDRDMKQALDESRYNITEKLNDAEEARLWESVQQQTRKAGESVVESVKKTALSAQPMRGTEYGFGGGDSAALNARAARAMEPEMMDLKSSGRTTSGQYKLTPQGERALAQRIVQLVEKSKNNAVVTPGLKVRGRFVADEGVGVGGQILVRSADDVFALNHEGFHSASNIIRGLEDAGLLTPGVIKNLPKEYAPLVSGAADRARSLDEYRKARQDTRGTSKPIEPSIVESGAKALVEEEAAVAASLRQKPTDNPSYNKALKQYNRVMGYADNQPFQAQTSKSMFGRAVDFAKKYGTAGALTGLAAGSVSRLFGTDQTKAKKPVRRANGGMIYASNGRLAVAEPNGTDTVPAMLTPGEFVVNAKSTKENLGLLHAINKNKGGPVNYLAKGGRPDDTQPAPSVDIPQETTNNALSSYNSAAALEQAANEYKENEFLTTSTVPTQIDRGRVNDPILAYGGEALRTAGGLPSAIGGAAQYGIGAIGEIAIRATHIKQNAITPDDEKNPSTLKDFMDFKNAGAERAKLGLAETAAGAANVATLNMVPSVNDYWNPITHNLENNISSLQKGREESSRKIGESIDNYTSSMLGQNTFANMMEKSVGVADYVGAEVIGGLGFEAALGSVAKSMDVANKAHVDKVIETGTLSKETTRNLVRNTENALPGLTSENMTASSVRAGVNPDGTINNWSKALETDPTLSEFSVTRGKPGYAAAYEGPASGAPAGLDSARTTKSIINGEEHITAWGNTGVGNYTTMAGESPAAAGIIPYVEQNLAMGAAAGGGRNSSVLIGRLTDEASAGLKTVDSAFMDSYNSAVDNLVSQGLPTETAQLAAQQAMTEGAFGTKVSTSMIEPPSLQKTRLTSGNTSFSQPSTISSAGTNTVAISNPNAVRAFKSMPIEEALSFPSQHAALHKVERLTNSTHIANGVNHLTHEKKAEHHNSGGLIYANNGAITPHLSRGTDTVPAMLTPGEFVINREASQKHMPILQAINNGYFNRGGIVNYLANGGAVMPQYSANGGPAKTGGGVSKDAASSSVGDALSAAVKSAVNDFNNSIQKGMESYSSMMQSSVEQMNSFGQTFSSATQTLANSAGTYSEAANTMPNSLTAQITGTQQVNITGLGAEGERIIGGASTAGALAGRQTSQNTVATYDRKELDGGLNTASKNKPITGLS